MISPDKQEYTPYMPTDSHSIPISNKPRSILTAVQAVEIFRHSLKNILDPTRKSAAALSRAYGVNEKTVRDIWNGRTWAEETQPLVPHRPIRHSGPPGRPRGCLDRAPRISRAPRVVEESSGTISPYGEGRSDHVQRKSSAGGRPPRSPRKADRREPGWSEAKEYDNNKAVYEAASSALRRVAAMAADTISRRPRFCGGSSHEDECAVAPQEKFSSTTYDQVGQGMVSAWQSHPEWPDRHVPAACCAPWIPAASDPKSMAGRSSSSSWEGDGSDTHHLGGEWPGYHSALLQYDAWDTPAARDSAACFSAAVRSTKASSDSDMGRGRSCASERADGTGDGGGRADQGMDAAQAAQMIAASACTLYRDSLEEEEEEEPELRWAGLRRPPPVVVAMGTAAGQAALTASEGQVGWLGGRRCGVDAGRDSCTRSSQGGQGPPAPQAQARSESVGCPVGNADSGGWGHGSGVGSAGSGGCGHGEGRAARGRSGESAPQC
jgi:hypothetical protein